ncbi:MAG: AAA family ATPase [Clostridia bacterium]|nr:AAA family ATPase [Clostridia bacterium]
MEKGKIIFLNGVTSSGKTSIARAIQNHPGEVPYFFALSNDLFQQMVGEKHLRENYWDNLGQALLMMYRTAKLFSDTGHHVIIDGMLLEMNCITEHERKMREILADCPLYLVLVDCPLEICRARNFARGNRGEYQSREQAVMMAKNVAYDLCVDTSVLTSEEYADCILTAFFEK